MEKKSLVVYYSLEGNCEWVAKVIQKYTGAEILSLEIAGSQKPTGYFKKYFWGGKQVFMDKKPELEPISVDLNSYDRIFLGTPVWAWGPAPALSAFLASRRIERKEVALFCCHGGGKGNTLEKIKKQLGAECRVIGEIDLKDPVKRANEEQEEKRILTWLQNLVSM